MYTKNQLLQMKIVDLTQDGEGIGKTDAFTWFVKDAVPGDVIEASVMKTKKTYGYARLQKVITPSPDRVKAKCPLARACGGCTLQNMSYGAQLTYKRNKVKNNLVRIGGFDENFIEGLLGETIGMEDPWRYRNKAIVPIGKDKNGKVIAGFYAAHSHDIIECEDCLLQPEEFKLIIKENKKAKMSHMLLRKGFKTGQIMAYGVENFENNAVLSGKLTNIYGPESIEDYIGDLKFNISPRSFFQVNPVQVEKLYGKAIEFADLKGDEIAWDLYCGIGTITLSLARHAKHVYGVEIVEDAIRDAEKNAKINGITNATFYVGKAEEVLPRWTDEVANQRYTASSKMPSCSTDSQLQDSQPQGSQVDLIVVDPPRKGCDIVCLETMLKIKPEKIVYVSCDSATLARDLKILCGGGYELKKAQPVDMFPQTTHTEVVSLLVKSE